MQEISIVRRRSRVWSLVTLLLLALLAIGVFWVLGDPAGLGAYF